MGDTYIAWLSSLSKDDLNLAGGKGANLGEMFNSEFPVPQAFVVTTDAFFYFLKETKLKAQIQEILLSIDVDNTEQLREKSEEIRNMIVQTPMPQKLEEEILEAYDHFNVDLDQIKDSPGALAILKSAREAVFVSVRSSATAEDLGDASFAGQQESFINVKGNQDLIEKVKRVFASIFTARSIFYRKKKGFDDLVGIAAIVQRMINSDKSGVMFSQNPVTREEEILIEAVFGQGEGIVSGRIKPDQYRVTRAFEITEELIHDKKTAIVRTAGGQTKTVALEPEKSKQRVLKTHEIKQLAEYAVRLEEHYGVPQDIEFSIENGEIYILQTRPVTTKAAQNNEKAQDLQGTILTQGLAASPGVASGTVKIVSSMDDLKKITEGDVLVTKMTNPDMVVSMQKASAIVTSEGGVTAHAAIVSREMGIPAVVGTSDALDVLTDGQEVTVDGFTGKVFSGLAENKSVEVLPVVETNTKIKVLVDLPQFAERAAKTKADGVGLVRLEGLIASNGKHPLAYEQENSLDAYKSMLKQGLATIADTFVGKPIWVRTSDIRSDEYSNLAGAPKEAEKNPMLGDHGIRFSLKHPGILKAELGAIKELADKGHKFGVMFPQVISVEEVKQAKKLFKEMQLDSVEFGVMIETPAAVILIKDICEQGIDFISFGTNDLTQYTLAIDRGNEAVQNLFDESHWAVLKQLSRVIRECKKAGVQTSICGQAGSKPEVVTYLVKQGIDSISVNADVAKEISELVQKLENGEEVPSQSEESSGGQEEENTQSQAPTKSSTESEIEPINDTESIEEELEEREEDRQEELEEARESVEVSEPEMASREELAGEGEIVDESEKGESDEGSATELEAQGNGDKKKEDIFEKE